MPIPFRRHPAGSWSKSFVVVPLLRPGRDWGLGTGCTECDFLRRHLHTVDHVGDLARASCIARTPNEKIRSMSPRESCWLMSSVKLCRKIPGDISVAAGKSTSSCAGPPPGLVDLDPPPLGLPPLELLNRVRPTGDPPTWS